MDTELCSEQQIQSLESRFWINQVLGRGVRVDHASIGLV